uniref:Uncharacterized protein n=1 Tax=Anguilla anguilla TaxID=7936 RepID=A0A0E9PT69_ANGAN
MKATYHCSNKIDSSVIHHDIEMLPIIALLSTRADSAIFVSFL